MVGAIAFEVRRLEGQLRDIARVPGGVPLRGEDVCLLGERGVILHLDGQFHAFTVEPALVALEFSIRITCRRPLTSQLTLSRALTFSLLCFSK